MTISEFSIDKTYDTNRTSAPRWIASHIRRNLLPFTGIFIGAISNAALAAVVPLCIGIAFNAVVLNDTPDYATVRWAAMALLGSQLLRACLQFLRNFSAEVVGQRLERDMRDEFYGELVGKSMTFHDLNPVGDTMARATNDVREINLLANPGLNLVIGSFMFLIMPIIFSSRIHPQLMILPAVFTVLYIIALVWYLRALSPVAEKARANFGTLNARLAEAIDGIEIVKGTAQETNEMNLFRKNATAYRDAVIAQSHIEARYIPLLMFGIANAIGFWHVTRLYELGEVPIGAIPDYVLLLGLFGFPVFVSLFAYSQVALGVAGAKRILELINKETELDQNAAGHDAEIEGAITFDNVSFGYVPEVQVLKDINLTIEPGETVAIVGQTGTGKTTLVKLINRIYDTTKGQVRVDGVDVRDWNMASLRQQVSIIEQDIFLFSRSIADNIAFGNPTATKDMIIAAAKKAQAHDFISGFKDGYETVIGERGVTLSGGQRQRIALARAFLVKPRILILDDSTSAIDSATEDQIQRAIREASQGQTTLLITHRLSQIRWADKIVVLRHGQIVAAGNHDELIETSAAYGRIFQRFGGDA